VLVSEGKALYMYGRPFDLKSGERLSEAPGPALWGGACGLLEDIARPAYGWKHERRHWVLRTQAGGAVKVVRGLARGTCLSVAGSKVFGLINDTQEIYAVQLSGGRRARKLWSVKAPAGSRPKAILAAAQAVFVAALPDEKDRAGGVIWVFAAADGKKLGELPLDGAPLFDGMSAEAGRLYVATQDGRLICFSE